MAKPRRLSLSEAEYILKHADVNTAKSGRRLINGDDSKYLLAAIDKGAKEVYLPNMGTMFKLTYKLHRPGMVWVQAVDSYVPCAWVTIEGLRREVDNAITTS